jgi:hypothetical protein
MNTAPAIAFSAHETVASELLIRLLGETERARATMLAGDMNAFEKILAARDELLEDLERTVQSIATASHSVPAPAAHEALVKLGAQLEEANASLTHGIRAERDLVAATLAATRRPDGVASRYAAAAPIEAHRLNLIR